MFENYKKVSLYIASEASYVYILSEQSLSSNSVTRQVNFNWTKMMENAKIKMRHFGYLYLVKNLKKPKKMAKV